MTFNSCFPTRCAFIYTANCTVGPMFTRLIGGIRFRSNSGLWWITRKQRASEKCERIDKCCTKLFTRERENIMHGCAKCTSADVKANKRDDVTCVSTCD